MPITIPLHEVKKYLTHLVQVEKRIDYKAGQVIFYEGHKPYGIYVLRTGRIRLFKKKNGREELLKIMEPLQLLGVSEIRKDRVFDYSARAETDVSVSFFSRSFFQTKKG